MAVPRATRHVSYEQVKRMLDFMEGHKDLANNDMNMAQGRHFAQELWGELTIGLNGTLGGTKKPMNGWRTYWGDFRRKMRIKNQKAKNRRVGTMPIPFNKLERKAMKLLEPYFIRKEKRMQEMRVIEVDKVKVEPGDSSSGSSSCGSDNNSSTETSDDSDSEGSVAKTIMKSAFVYPSLEAQQKRAEADLARARAEADLARARADQSYAHSAVQAAQAAQAQVDALTSLARATNAQAEALEHIAVVLDRPDQIINM